MAITKKGGRQYPLVAKVEFDFNDFNAGAVTTTTVFEALDLPGNAVITGGELVISTAFVGPTAATIAVGDGLSAARYLADTNILATGRTPLVPTGYETLTPDSVDVDVAMSVAIASAGAGYLTVEYIISDRANEVQPV